MANQEHVEIVKQGADAIAAWREGNPKTKFYLSHADLSGAELSYADLRDADLSHADLRAVALSGADLRDAELRSADLRDANLSGADLRDAELRSTDLRDANLSGANLYRANLHGANLRGADLNRADLQDANLRGADLRGAELRRANVTGAIFAKNDLAETKGLEEVIHHGPSEIGVSTLFESKGKIPDVFLRGCGVPEELITHLPSIMASMQPIQFYSCFISYSSEDDKFARRLHARLTAEKLRVWFAPEDMKGGKKIAEQIDTAIRVHDRLLLVLSEKSMSSEWVKREIERAREKEKRGGKNVLFPIALVPMDAIRAWECLDTDTGEDLAKTVRAYHIPDFSQWKQEDAFEKAFGELMRDLKATGEAEADRVGRVKEG